MIGKGRWYMHSMTEQEARQLSPLNLAYIGDVIYELFTREHIMELGNMPVNQLHKRSIAIVKASAQSRGLEEILPLLTQEELAVYKRGRNANGSHVPKNAEPQEYRRATGVEALFGYLHLTGQDERAEQLFEMIYKSLTARECMLSGT